MGAYFSNLQVYVGAAPPKQLHQQLIKEIRSFLSFDGYDKVVRPRKKNNDEHLLSQTALSIEEDDLGFDKIQRNVLIEKAVTNSRWLGIYDEGIEPPAATALIELGKFLSKITKNWVVGASVYDSDVLELQLFQSGNHLHNYVSPRGSKETHRNGLVLDNTHLQLWRPLLQSDAQLEQLKETWQNPELEAEGILHNTARLLGIEPERAMLGAANILQHEMVSLSEFTHLYAEKLNDNVFERTEGLPKLVRHSGTTGPLLIVGRNLSTLHCAFENQGGASEGVKIILKGNALDQELIRVDYLDLSSWIEPERQINNPERNKPYRLECYLESFEDEKGSKGLQTILPHFPIAGGIKEINVLKLGINYRRINSTRSQTSILIKLVGQALKFGYGKLYLSFIPLNNPEGQGLWEWQVEPMV